MIKILKITLYILGSIVLFALIGGPIFVSTKRSSMTKNTFSHFNEGIEISFSDMKWVKSKIGDNVVEKTAFFIPVKIDGLKGSLYMQFDSGATETSLYGKTLCQVMDPNYTWIKTFDKDSVEYFGNFKMQIGQTEFISNKIKILSSIGGAISDTSFVVVGTLGFDSFFDRTLILDFKKDLLAITQKSAEELSYDLSYVPKASVKKYPILLPTKLGGKKIGLFYDTGSSMFSVLTSNRRLQKANKTQADTICCISAWGKKYPVHRKKLSVPITMGEHKFENKNVYGCELLDKMNYAPERILYGITGNLMFNNTVVVIDRKYNKFGLAE